jgi:hypothetical protein
MRLDASLFRVNSTINIHEERWASSLVLPNIQALPSLRQALQLPPVLALSASIATQDLPISFSTKLLKFSSSLVLLPHGLQVLD